MKISKLKTVFAFVALFPLVYGLASIHARAEERTDLKKLEMAEIPDTAENRQKYGFLKILLLDDASVQAAQPTVPGRISIAEIDVKPASEKLVFAYLQGSLYCGANNCSFAGFKGTADDAAPVIDVAVTEGIYTQTCGSELSLIFVTSGDPGGAARWVYNGKEFEYKETYAGLDSVPQCK
jgi:hypothetical protein